ncbi:hypothetical protein [Bifidobacterium xylocopae]|uniref:Uncharacterized protein n=1 Tax=Bifidobacterium xylocopae TaxID=2493119 RepID=A0A366KFU4_9BIFI|nr:hypothetical protein [Bifidobacterium xylocopae]RBP99963.1 hypothetical protein CRD59_00390 [Bifidobacterium xylocopae]
MVRGHEGESQEKPGRRKAVILVAAAVVLVLVVALGAWGVSSSRANARAEAGRQASASKAAAKRRAGDQAKRSASAKPPASAFPRPGDQASAPSSAGQTDPGSSQPNPGGGCAAYQGTYTNAAGAKATVVPNCSVEADGASLHIYQVTPGATGASGRVDAALDLEMEPRNGHAIAYTIFPAGVGAGYPGEDVSHTRLIDHSGGPVSAMSYQDYRQAVYVLD